ncbi:MAG: rod shape-determining protein RodA [Bacteroidetes bacterium]|nr:rod shape-determining protein RodA [Bacteroidota bacterium]
MMVLVIGKEVNGAKAWLSIGSFSLQPAEFAKIGTALALAKFLSQYNIKITEIRTLVPVAIIIIVPIGLIALQPDAGSILVFTAFTFALFREGLPGIVLFFGFTLIILLFVSLIIPQLNIIISLLVLAYASFALISKRYRESFYGLLIYIGSIGITWIVSYFAGLDFTIYKLLVFSFFLAGMAYLIIGFFRRIAMLSTFVLFMFGAIVFTNSVDYVFHNLMEEHQRKRVNILLGLEQDPLGYGYNVNQSQIAIGSGGFLGKGFLQGTQTKFNFVPEQSTDFIFCTIGEEWGFIGSAVVIGLFMFLMYRIIIISERQRSTFSRIYGYCVASVFFFHFTINIGMTIGLLPVIGIPLPFFSYGGSSLWSFTIMLFILLRLDASRLEILK